MASSKLRSPKASARHRVGSKLPQRQARDTPLAQFATWREQAEDIREALLRERERQREKLSTLEEQLSRERNVLNEIETALSTIQVSDVVAGREEELPTLEDASTSEVLLLAVMTFGDRGASAAEVQSWLSDRGRPIKTKYVHTYLHRLLGDEKLKKIDEPGRVRRYFAPDVALLDRRSSQASDVIVELKETRDPLP